VQLRRRRSFTAALAHGHLGGAFERGSSLRLGRRKLVRIRPGMLASVHARRGYFFFLLTPPEDTQVSWACVCAIERERACEERGGGYTMDCFPYVLLLSFSFPFSPPLFSLVLLSRPPFWKRATPSTLLPCTRWATCTCPTSARPTPPPG